MRNLLRRMEPKNFGDITAVISLYRPGPMAANAHNDYADRSNGRQEITPIHPELKDALEPILGDLPPDRVPGTDHGHRPAARRIHPGRRRPDAASDGQEEEGSPGGGGSQVLPRHDGEGFLRESAQALWDTILPFAGYAFNKSHAAGYALVAYWTAYLKANYPAAYMAALLTSVSDDKDKMAVYLAECRAQGIKVLPPDVNESGLRFTPVGQDIRFGMGAVRSVSEDVVDSIVATRKEGRLRRLLRLPRQD